MAIRISNRCGYLNKSILAPGEDGAGWIYFGIPWSLQGLEEPWHMQEHSTPEPTQPYAVFAEQFALKDVDATEEDFGGRGGANALRLFLANAELHVVGDTSRGTRCGINGRGVGVSSLKFSAAFEICFHAPRQ